MLKRFVPLEIPDGITNKFSLPTTYTEGDITLFVNGQLVATRNLSTHPLGYILNETSHYFEFFTPLILGDTLYVIYDDSKDCTDITSSGGGGVINLTFAGTVYNSDNIPTNAYYQVFVINNNVGLTKWSAIRETEFTDYSINVGDPDLSSQDNYLLISNKGNEFVLIAVWTKDSESRNNYAQECAFIVYELNNEVVYLQDIQLNRMSSLACDNWTVPESVSNNEPIIVLNNNTNEFTYEAFDITHYVQKMYNNEIVFDYLGPRTIEYSFGHGFTHSNIYYPTSSTDLEVQVRLTDAKGQSITCSKIVKVYYTLTSDFTWTPSLIYTGDNIYINSIVNSDYIDIRFDVDGQELTGADVVYTTSILKDITVTQYTTYFNGFNNVTLELTKIISMQSLGPIINLKCFLLDEDQLTYRFSHNGYDIDGYIKYVKWDIYRNNRDSLGASNWSLYYSTSRTANINDWIFSFIDILGELKVVCTIYDNFELSASQECLIDNICDNEPEIIFYNNIDWTKNIKMIEFPIIEIQSTWMEKRIEHNWVEKIERIEWDMKPQNIKFSLDTKQINFSYKLNCLN